MFIDFGEKNNTNKLPNKEKFSLFIHEEEKSNDNADPHYSLRA